jgi:Ca2+-transporting ATPase
MLNWTVLLPIHILWINLITDTLPALALGMEKAEDDVMEAPPRDAKVSFFSEGVGFSIAYRGIIQGMITLFVYWYGNTYFDHKVAMTMAFATLGMIQLAHALNSRSMDKSLFRIGFFTNGYVNVAILISGVLQLGIILVPGLNTIFKVVPLNGIQWAVVAVSSFSIIPIVEIIKLIANLKQKKAVRKKA